MAFSIKTADNPEAYKGTKSDSVNYKVELRALYAPPFVVSGI